MAATRAEAEQREQGTGKGSQRTVYNQHDAPTGVESALLPLLTVSARLYRRGVLLPLSLPRSTFLQMAMYRFFTALSVLRPHNRRNGPQASFLLSVGLHAAGRGRINIMACRL